MVNMKMGLLISLLLIICFLTVTVTGEVQFVGDFSQKEIASSLMEPTSMQVMKDGRILIAEKSGSIKLLEGETVYTLISLDNVDNDGERGVQGVIEDPEFLNNGFIYAYYNLKVGNSSHNRISRFTMNGNEAEASSELTLLELPDLGSSTKDNGGALVFGSDGMLYALIGDNQQSGLAMKITSIFGKTIRINKNDGSAPTDNPFYYNVDADSILQTIWTTGHKNSVSMSLNKKSGQIVVNDVGTNLFEEINGLIKGANYGYGLCEGDCDIASFESPLYTYPYKGFPDDCAITGGTFYPEKFTTFPATYFNKYFFIDYCGGDLKYIDLSISSPSSSPSPSPNATTFAKGIIYSVSLDVDNQGRLLYLTSSAYFPTSLMAISGNAVVTQSEPTEAPTGKPTTTSNGSKEKVNAEWKTVGIVGISIGAIAATAILFVVVSPSIFRLMRLSLNRMATDHGEQKYFETADGNENSELAIDSSNDV